MNSRYRTWVIHAIYRVKVIGRERIVYFFSGSSGKIEIDFKDDGPVYETQNKPDTFLVISNFIATIINSGYRYENRIVCQFTLDKQGKIKELIEYADPIARQKFLDQLQDSKPEATSQDNLRAAYQQLCISYHAIDDFRAKLLGFLPLATTGTGIFLLLNNPSISEFLGPIGTFGFVITLGLLFYELYGIKKCTCLIRDGKVFEKRLNIKDGQFTNRPLGVAGLIDERLAAGVIYPAVLSAWMFLGLAPHQQSQDTAKLWAICVFFVGVAVSFFCIIKIKRRRGQEVARTGGRNPLRTQRT